MVKYMKKKLLSKTYLNEAEKYKIKFFLDEDDYYICVKKLIKISERFIINHGIVAMDNGYYILEVVPKNENYAMRLFLNEKKEPIEYYFDIIKESGIDKDTKIPYFLDLYLDITVLINKEVHILDEDEFLYAYKTNDITSNDYMLAIKIKDKLLEEIDSNTNILMNMDYSKYLGDF
jgi:hypothetical protein